MYRKIAVATALAALALPAAAQAHVTVQPKQAQAGGFAVENIRVPNERDDASTVKVAVQMPDGIASVSYQPTPGWKVKVTKEKAAQPIETHGGEVTEQIDTVTFTGNGETGKIAPGQFVDFPLSFQIPGKAGDTLTFKALQTYSSGEVVRWIGAEDSDQPAPTLAVTAAEDEAAAGGHGSASGGAKTPETAATTAAPASDAAASDDDGGASQGLAIAGLVVGALGLLFGAAALLVARRRQAAPARP